MCDHSNSGFAKVIRPVKVMRAARPPSLFVSTMEVGLLAHDAGRHAPRVSAGSIRNAANQLARPNRVRALPRLDEDDIE